MTNLIDPKDANFYIKARLDCGISIEIIQRQEGIPLEVNIFPKPGTKIEDSARIVNGELHINMTTESAIGLYQLLNLILVPPKKRKKFLGVF